MDQFTKEGRKLRPRKTAQKPQAAEKVEFTPRSSYERNDSDYRRPEGRPYSGGERRSYQSGEYRERGGYNRGERGGYSRDNHGYNRGDRDSYRSNRDSYRSNSEGGYSKPRQDGERRYGNHSGGRDASAGRGYQQRRPQDGQQRSSGPARYGKPAAPAHKKAYGNKRNGGKPTGAKFNKQSNEGILRMIERRPVVNENAVEQQFEGKVKDVVRLNKFIANSGVCSRREADTLIQAGVVTVNGEVVTELGTKVNIYTDDIRFNGERLKGEEKVYIIMNKPKGYVTTASDPHAERTVIDLLKACPSRVYPVGRLDKNTTGVLLLTNDGEIAERLTHPSYDKKKIYQVALDKPLKEEDYNTLLSGVTLSDGETKADELEYIDESDKRKLGIEIHSGKNRIVRRMFEAVGYTVKALDRVYFAGLTKKGLKKGEWRYLSAAEVNILKIGAYV